MGCHHRLLALAAAVNVHTTTTWHGTMQNDQAATVMHDVATRVSATGGICATTGLCHWSRNDHQQRNNQQRPHGEFLSVFSNGMRTKKCNCPSHFLNLRANILDRSSRSGGPLAAKVTAVEPFPRPDRTTPINTASLRGRTELIGTACTRRHKSTVLGRPDLVRPLLMGACGR